MRSISLFFILFLFSLPLQVKAQGGGLKMALVKYNGGGDWYAVVTALENMAQFANQELRTNFTVKYETVEIGSVDIYNYPFLFMTGHGNVVLNGLEMENLRNYLLGGGFMFIDDDFGMEPYIMPMLDKLLPETKLVELPFTHPLFHQKFNFNNGMPKVHQHNSKAPRTYGLFHEDRLVLLYAAESNISDGWEDRSVHRDPEEVRQQSLRMGANILQYVFRN